MTDFTDLYLFDKNPEQSLIFPGPVSITPDLLDLAGRLRDKCREEDKTDFTVSDSGIDFRGHRMKTVGGIYYALRKMPERVWSLAECGLHTRIRHYIADPRHCMGGLFIVSGMPGNGKSTTCAGIITERLNRYGGMCATVEDPVEMPLQGIHGKGLCLQRDIGKDTDFATAVKETMRAYPTGANTMMLIGEVRDPETAALALRSSVDGRLVVVTVHAGDIIQTVHRILTLASDSLGVREARNLLASSLRLVIHQRLVGTPPDVELKTNSLFDTTEVVGVIRNPKTPLESLKNQLHQQAQRLQSNQPISVRRL